MSSVEIAESDKLTLLTPTKTYVKSRSDVVELVFPSGSSITSTPQKNKISKLIDIPSPSLKRKINYEIDNDSPRKIKLKQSIKQKSKIIRNKNSHISKLKMSVSKIKTHNNIKNVLHTHRFPSCNSRALVTMQFKNKRQPWTKEEKNLSLNLFYKSPTAYKFLRLQKINLPAPSTIRRWIGQSKYLPGFDDLFLSHIKKKFEQKCYKEKACTVSFDEMYIKEFLEYSKDYDFIEGFQDLGSYGRSNKSANCVLVFMARGIYSKWKFPIAYFLTHSTINKTILKNLIIDVLNNLIDVGLCPKLIVCDQGTTNQSALKLLNISEDNPFFFVNGYKIFSVFDVPHLLKSVRNNFIEACFQKNDKMFSFKDIKDTYQLDKLNKKSKALFKITDAHIHPSSFQKMRVKLACQLLSNSMAATIRTCVATGQLCSKTAIDTADFVQFMNNLFDCLNSRSLYSSNPYNCALTHSGNVKTFLLAALNYFSNLKKIKNGKISQPPCFKGFSQSIKGILQFFEEEKSNDVSFILTNRLNQDALENAFSIFRQKGGYNKNPTSRTIRTSFRSSCIFSLCASKGANCEETQETDDFNVIIDPVINVPISSLGNEINETDSSCSDTESIISSNSSTLPFDQNQITKVTLEDCSVTYFAGYLAYKCIKKFNCHFCQNNFLTSKDLNEKNQILLINKNYSSFENDNTGLKAPSISFNKIINQSLDIFEKYFENYSFKKKLRFKLMQKIKVDVLINQWLNDGNDCNCKEHKLFIIDHLLICKIFKKTQTISTTSQLAKVSKLKILNHI